MDFIQQILTEYAPCEQVACCPRIYIQEGLCWFNEWYRPFWLRWEFHRPTEPEGTNCQHFSNPFRAYKITSFHIFLHLRGLQKLSDWPVLPSVVGWIMVPRDTRALILGNYKECPLTWGRVLEMGLSWGSWVGEIS
jgi:hypothetical protein